MTLELQTISIDSLASLITALTSSNKKGNSDTHLVEDIWEKIMLFLDANGLQNLSLVSKNICIIALKSVPYIWYVHNKRKICTIISKSISSLDKNHGNRFKETAGFIRVLIQSGATNAVRRITRKCKYYYNRPQQALKTVVQHHIQQGNIQEAKNILIDIRKQPLQVCDIDLVGTVKMQVECDDIENAEDTLKNITEQHFQLEALMYIAQGQAEYGHIDSVIKTMEQVMTTIDLLKNEEKRNQILIEVDRLFVEMGNMPDTNETAQGLSKKYGRSKPLWCIQVKGLIQNKRIDEAKRMITDKKKEIPYKEDTEKEYYLKYIARIQSEIDSNGVKNTLEEARNMTLQFGVSDNTVRGLLKIAQGQMQYRDIEGAKSTLKSIIEMMDKVQLTLYLFNKIVQLLKELNDFTTAKNIILLYIPDKCFEGTKIKNYSKADSLHDIAVAQLKKGNKSDAKSTLEEAKRVARLIEESYFKVKTLIKIAQTTFQCDDVEKTESTLREAENNMSTLDGYYRAIFLVRIATLQFQMNAVSIAKATLSNAQKIALDISRDYTEIRPDYHRDRVFAALFKAYFQIGDIENMMQALKSIWYLDKKLEVLLEAIHVVEKQIYSNARATLISSIESIQKILLSPNQI